MDPNQQKAYRNVDTDNNDAATAAGTNPSSQNPNRNAAMTINWNPYQRVPLPTHAHLTAATAAASYPPPTPAMGSLIGVNILPSAQPQHHQSYQQLANEVILLRRTNAQLQHELLNKTIEADDYRLRYYPTALENDRILKESLEKVEAKNRLQERELTRLKAQLRIMVGQRSSNDSITIPRPSPSPPQSVGENETSQRKPTTTASASNEISTGQGTKQSLLPSGSTQRVEQGSSSTVPHTAINVGKKQSSALTPSELFHNKSGCPLCLTKNHTILNCNVLRYSGYHVTHRSLGDANDTSATTVGNRSSSNEERSSNVGTATGSAACGSLETKKIRSGSPEETNNDPTGDRRQFHNDGRGRKETQIVINSEEAVKVHMQRQHEEKEEQMQRENSSPEEKDESKTEQKRPPGQTETSDTYSNEDDEDNKLDDDDDDDDEYASDEVQFVRETGKNPLADFAHARYDCRVKPFSENPAAFCNNCYCYVCDVKASECQKWVLSGDDEPNSHCYAERSISKWKNRRSRARSKRKRPERARREIESLLSDLGPSSRDLPPTRRTRTPNPTQSIPDGNPPNTKQQRR